MTQSCALRVIVHVLTSTKEKSQVTGLAVLWSQLPNESQYTWDDQSSHSWRNPGQPSGRQERLPLCTAPEQQADCMHGSRIQK